MKHNRKWFFTVETVLAACIFILAIQMIVEKRSDHPPKISVIIPDSENHHWSAFRYGLKMAAQDTGSELLIVSTGKNLTAEEELELISQEIEQDTQAVILHPMPGADFDQKLKKLEKKIPIMLVKDTISQNPPAAALPAAQPELWAERWQNNYWKITIITCQEKRLESCWKQKHFQHWQAV